MCGSAELLSVTPRPPLIVFAESPRYLGMSLRTDGIALDIISLHALCEGAAAHEKAAWWSGAWRSSRKSQKSSAPSGVANARLGSVTSTVGASRADEESDHGRAFHELLLQWGVSGPCEDTWFSGSGKSRRGDFVCVPSEWLAKATDCSVEHQMILGWKAMSTTERSKSLWRSGRR